MPDVVSPAFRVVDALPKTPEDLDAAWLTDVLGRPVAQASIDDDVIWGTATKVFVDVRFEDADEPVRLCVKGGFDERLAGFALGPAYRLEANFFGKLAPKLTINLPRAWGATIDTAGEGGVIVLEDLSAANTTFGEPTEPWTPDQVAGALEQLALLHAQTWGSTPAKLGDWIEIGSTSLRATTPVLLSVEHWQAQAALDGGPPLPDESQRERIAAAFQRLWQLDDAGDLCVAHGDGHIGNTFVRDGSPGFLDWQGVCLSSWSYDVAYFVGGALDIADRQAKDADLVRHYLAALSASGGPSIAFDDAWLDIRRHALHGFLWAMTPPVMQPLERVNAMAARHLQHMEDMDTLAVL